LVCEVLAWEFGDDFLSAKGGERAVTRRGALLRPPKSWWDGYVPQFLGGVFGSIARYPDKTTGHELRQLCIQMGSIHRSTFPVETQRQMASVLVEGCLHLLKLSQQQEGEEEYTLVALDAASLLHRAISNYGWDLARTEYISISQSSFASTLLPAAAGCAADILRRSFSKLLEANWDTDAVHDVAPRMEECADVLLDCLVLLAEEGGAGAVGALARAADGLYETYVLCHLQAAAAEERRVAAGGEDVDEVGDAIAETQREERAVAAAGVGRLDVARAAQILGAACADIFRRLAVLGCSAQQHTDVAIAAATLEEVSSILLFLARLVNYILLWQK